MIDKPKFLPNLTMLKLWLNEWRSPVSRIATILVFALLAYWGWQHRLSMQKLFNDFDLKELMTLSLMITLSVVLSALGFTLLVRYMGYRFTYQDGYHSLNLSQIAAMVPGKIWGLTGLAGILWTRGITRQDSVLIIFLHTTLTLSAAGLVGVAALATMIGWSYSALCLVPIFLLLIRRSWFESIRTRYIGTSSALPAPFPLFITFAIGLMSWAIASACFLFFIYGIEQHWPNSPLLVASAFAAAYIGGFISIFTPAGLGVREGIIALLLGPTLGSEEAFTAALGFRILQTAVLWLHIALTLAFLTLSMHTAQKGTR
jgi:hypothetical protein